MSERSKRFKIGAVTFFFCAMVLLGYVFISGADDGPAAVAVDPSDVPAPANTPSEAPTVVNSITAEEVSPPATAEEPPPVDAQTKQEQLRKTRSLMD